MKFYSQSGEDFLLHSLLGRQEDGFYIDIGAFDGVHLSNSFVFEKLGWSGVCVEPHPEYFPHLCRARPNAVCVNAAIVGRRQADSTIFKKERLGLLSGIVADQTPNMEDRYARRDMRFEGFDEIEVPCLTLNELIERHAPDRRRIGFLSIDTEGNEADILETFSFDRYEVQVVVVEANDDTARRTMETLLRSRGYKFARQIGCNLVFARRADDAGFLAYKKIDCEIEDTLHPLGEGATLSINRARRITDGRFHAAPNVLCQHPNQPLSSLIEFFPDSYVPERGLAARFVHAVNFFPAPSGEQAGVAATMCEAKSEDARAHPDAGSVPGEIVLVNVQNGGDADQTPEGFVRARDLDRDVRNLASFRHPRSLPLLFDILDRLVEQAGPDDYVVYTNADICLQPSFYRNLRELVAFGFDAITINRRTIGARGIFPSGDSPLALAETGMLHGGFDCFVFRRALYDRFVKNHACLGTARVMRGLLHNLAAHADQMVMLRNVALTYHHGNDVLWNADRYEDQASFNLKECVRTLTQLCEEPARQARLTAFCEGHPEAAVFRRIAKGQGQA